MTGRLLLTAIVALIVACVWAAVSDRARIAALAAAAEPVAVVQGKDAAWWSRRAVQARRDANKRGHTIQRLRGNVRRGFIPWYWERIGWCESHHDYDYNGRSGFDGWLQFNPGTWSANRLPGYPTFAWQASPFQQLVVAEIVLSQSGWHAWPKCARKVGLL